MNNNIIAMPAYQIGQSLQSFAPDSAVFRAFQSVFNREPDEWEAADLGYYLKKGLQPDLLVQAIRATRDAPRPSWRYTVGILRRCLLEGATTRDDWERRCQAHFDAVTARKEQRERRREEWRRMREAEEAARQQQRFNAALHRGAEWAYTQREYTREQLESLFWDPFAEEEKAAQQPGTASGGNGGDQVDPDMDLFDKI